MAAIAVLAVASSSAKPAMKYRRQWIQRIDEHIYTTVKRVFPHLRADKSAEGVKALAQIGRLRPEPVSETAYAVTSQPALITCSFDTFNTPFILMILFDLAQKYGRDSGYAICAGPDVFVIS